PRVAGLVRAAGRGDPGAHPVPAREDRGPRPRHVGCSGRAGRHPPAPGPDVSDRLDGVLPPPRGASPLYSDAPPRRRPRFRHLTRPPPPAPPAASQEAGREDAMFGVALLIALAAAAASAAPDETPDSLFARVLGANRYALALEGERLAGPGAAF